jgi:hypothetical protein
MPEWTCALELDEGRQVAGGSTQALAAAIRRGADLRIGTRFRHDQHIDVESDNPEPVREVAEFGVTYLVRDSWAAGIMSLRQPVALPAGFGERPSMSFFLYNQDGEQAIARPYLDGLPATAAAGPSTPQVPARMPRYRVRDGWDEGTNAPSSNFAYDFDLYRFWVWDGWQEVLAHDEHGHVRAGDVEALAEAFWAGRQVKVGVSGLAASLAAPTAGAPEHEVFVQTSSCYYYTQQRLFIAGSHPVVRVRPATPLRYESQAWDFGWLLLRSDGRVVYRRCDPYTLAFADQAARYPVRWFVR